MVTRWLNDPRWMRLGPILALALALRLIWALLVPVAPVSDAWIYDAFAREIAEGRGYRFPTGGPTAYWPVGPAALYGGVYALFGGQLWLVSAVNLILGGALVAGIWRIGVLRFDRRVAALAALAAALWPLWVQFTTIPNSELPFVTFMVAAFAARQEPGLPGWLRIVLSTALMVAAAFMRPTIVPLIPLLPLLDGAWRRPLRAGLHVALALLVAGALFAPWMERNRALFGTPVLVSANFGANLWMGNNPQSNGGYMGLPEIATENEVTRDAYFKDRAIRFIREHPVDYVRLSLKRVVMSFDRESIGVVWNIHSIPAALQPAMKAVSALYWYAMLLLSLAGVVLFLRSDPARLVDPLLVSAGLFVAVAVLVVGMDRYHMPLMPFITLFAAYAIDRWLARRGSAELNDPANHYQN